MINIFKNYKKNVSEIIQLKDRISKLEVATENYLTEIEQMKKVITSLYVQVTLLDTTINNLED